MGPSLIPGAPPSVIPAAIEVGQFFKARPPVVEIVVVLLFRTGRVERADGAGCRTAALVIEHEQRVVRWSCWVIICCSQTLQGGKKRNIGMTNSTPQETLLESTYLIFLHHGLALEEEIAIHTMLGVLSSNPLHCDFVF